MQHSHFAIGDNFYTRHAHSATGWAKWRVTDKGTRTIAAIRVDVVKRVRYNALGLRTTTFLTEAAAQEEDYFTGPPYAVPELLFDEDQFPDCHPQPLEP